MSSSGPSSQSSRSEAPSPQDIELRAPTVRERQHLKSAAGHPQGHLPAEVSTRLVKAMLDEGWVYREDGDGYRLDPSEALVYQGSTPWRITARGRWAALTVRQRRMLGELWGDERPWGDLADARAQALKELLVAEDRGGVLRLTALGERLVREFAQSCEA